MNDSLTTPTALHATATKLRLCQRCPRLLAYDEKGEKNVWLVGWDGTGAKFGGLFHDEIAGKFHNDAAKGKLPELAKVFQGEAQALKERLADLVRTRYFTPLLAQKSAALQSEQLTSLAKGTEFWIQCLASFLSGIPSLWEAPEKNLSAVFLPPEKAVFASYPYPADGHGQTLEVVGRYDAVLFNPDAKEVMLFEFKGLKPTNVTVELSQALIYAWLVLQKTGLVPSVTLLYLEDEVSVVYPASDVKNMLDNLPHLFDVTRQVLEKRLPLPRASDQALCGKCKYQAQCDADWGVPLSPAISSPAPHKSAVKQEAVPDAAAEVEAQADEGPQRMSQLTGALSQLGVFVSDEGYVEGPCFIRLKVKPNNTKGTTVSKIEKTAKDLQVALALSSPPLIQAQSGYVGVDVPRTLRRVLTLPDMMKAAAAGKAGEKPDSAGAFPLGLDIDGRVFWVDLAEPSMTSILIGGTSGSGKSVLLRAMVVGLLLNAPFDGVSFTLVDPKRVTFTDMKNLRGLEEKAILSDLEPIMKSFGTAVEEMERRYVLMEKAGVSDIAGYNASVPASVRLKRRVLILDEYADMISDKQTRADLENFVQRICQKGRAAGIHLILATQRPDAKVVTGIIKANLQLRIALKVTSQANSQIILGEGIGQAQYLLGHGDMLVGGSVPLQRLQAPLASAELLDGSYFY